MSTTALSSAGVTPGLDASPPPLPPDSVYTSCYCEENIYLLAQAFTQLSDAHSTDGRGPPWPWQLYVVFISNGGKTVALWSQKARDGVIIWDYHVVLVLVPRAPHDPGEQSDGAPTPGRPTRQAWVYDFDTTLPVPCPWIEYVAGTIPYALDSALARGIDERFHSLFRVVPADVYLDHFASDRSHMIAPAQATMAVEAQRAPGDGGDRRETGEVLEAREEGPRYSSPPPPYPPLRGAKARAMGIAHNLMASFVAMGLDMKPGEELAEGLAARRGGEGEGEGEAAGSTGDESIRHGQVMDAGGFVRWLAGSAKLAA